MSTLSIRGLRVRGRHGVLERERVEGQDFLVDATLELDTGAAAASDELADTVDYAQLAADLAVIVAGPPLRLIETLAARLLARCLAEQRVSAATVCVHKPGAPVGVEVSDITVTVTGLRG